MQALLDLPNPANNLIASLQLFHEKVEGHIRCLQSLGKSPEELETFLVPIILEKLPAETKRNIARTHEDSQWTINQLQVFLLTEVQIFQTSQQTASSGSYQQLTPTASFHTAASKKSRHTRKELTSKTQKCTYCKGSHPTIDCEVYKDLESRLAVIKQQKLCYNCLEDHHASQCRSKNHCW